MLRPNCIIFGLGLIDGLAAQQGRQLTAQVPVQVLPGSHEAATRLFKETLTKEVTDYLANGAQTTPANAANGSTGATFKYHWTIMHGLLRHLFFTVSAARICRHE